MSDGRALDDGSRVDARAPSPPPADGLAALGRLFLKDKAHEACAILGPLQAHAATDAHRERPVAAAATLPGQAHGVSASAQVDQSPTHAESEQPFAEREPSVDMPSRSANRALGWRSLLFFFDLFCLALPAVAVVVARTSGGNRYTSLLVAAAMPVVGLGLLALEDRRRGELVPTTDVAALGTAVGLGVLAVVVADTVLGAQLGTGEILVAGLIALVAIVLARLSFAAWLGAARVRGRHQVTALLVGTGEEAYKLWAHLRARPDSGYVVRAAVGDPEEAAIHDWDVPLMGSVLDTVAAARACGASVALVSPAAVDIDQLNELVHELPSCGVELQLWPGFDHLAANRMQAASVARLAVLRVSTNEAPSWQVPAKRVIDIVGAALLLVVALPILALAALAVRLSDRGPVLFRQKRVGKDGRIFDCIKLRTMTHDAHEHLERLQHRNERSGPLFKVNDDPRTTAVGRILRALSLDELPQLVNVLSGDMSLVGPRPALPEETVKFDAELQRRHEVVPGITGLWQVEARDNPAFTAYRDLDLYYVDNWSLGLDLAVLFVTVPSVMGRGLRAIRTSNRRS